MTPDEFYLYLLLGGIIVLAIFVRALFRKTAVPALVFFLAAGLFLSYFSDVKYISHLMSEENRGILEFMAKLGLFALLFRAGLESNPVKLKHHLGEASFVWVGNFLISGLAGFAAGYWLLGMDMISSLVIGAALTATSIAVSVAIWQDADMMERDEASLMLDVAEMDDITGVIVLALLITLIPLIQEHAVMQDLLGSGVQVLAWFIAKLVLLAAGCILFSAYAERPVTKFLTDLTPGFPHVMLVVVGFGMIVAGIAVWLGFSLAIGALFAGLIFSSDPSYEEIDEVFEPIYLLLSPFFFIGIGLSVDPGMIVAGLSAGAVLFLAAFFGKFLGGALPARRYFGWAGAAAIGISLVPRAEITLLIAERSHALGGSVLSSQTLAAIIFVSVATCIVSPLLVRHTLNRLD